MKRGHEYHKTHESKKPYCGFNWDTGGKIEGIFLTLAEVERKRRDGFMVEQAERFNVGLPYGS